MEIYWTVMIQIAELKCYNYSIFSLNLTANILYIPLI